MPIDKLSFCYGFASIVCSLLTWYNISKTLQWMFFKFGTWQDIHPIDLYTKSDVEWNFPSLIDYWLITNTPLILALFWFLDIISKSVWWIFFYFCTYTHLGTIHLWYKYDVDWIISSLINNQSIDWKFTKVSIFALNA